MGVYLVEVNRFGSIRVEAENEDEAIDIANEEATADNVVWDDDWTVTDVQEV